jgi:hypothetical protein
MARAAARATTIRAMIVGIYTPLDREKAAKPDALLRLGGTDLGASGMLAYTNKSSLIIQRYKKKVKNMLHSFSRCKKIPVIFRNSS